MWKEPLSSPLERGDLGEVAPFADCTDRLV
jgi:hypothetical protein